MYVKTRRNDIVDNDDVYCIESVLVLVLIEDLYAFIFN